jgi:putative transposase
VEHQGKSFMGCDYNIDEVFLTIKGKRHYLWRAVDQDDNVLDILVQSRRNKKAAKKFFRKLLKGLTYVPRVVITRQVEELRRGQARDSTRDGASPESLSQ